MTDDPELPTELASLADLTAEPHAEVFSERPRTVRLRLDAGESVPPHRHPGLDVLIYAVDGELTLGIDDETHRLEAGDAIRFSGDREVSPEAVSDATALVVFAPRPE